MLSAMNASSASAGGQRDSPIESVTASAGKAPAADSLRATDRIVAYTEMTEPTVTERRLEILSTVLLALATVATAWAAYQSRQWTGEQSQGYSHATAARIAVNRTSALANRQVQIDVATFIQWVDARQRGDEQLADFY